MRSMETLNKNLAEIKERIYDQCLLEITGLSHETEGIDYDACRFQLNGLNVICRSSKITPKKVGQFVTCWKRNEKGITAPYCETDPVDLYVINARAGKQFGQFVFPKSTLIEKGIISTKDREGKRGFRVYPAWDIAQTKQAEKTQKWQENYFYEIEEETDLKKVNRLYQIT